jgi:hypothetical protein
MVVAMVAVGMVQVALDQIVYVVAMRNGFVAATGTMLVIHIVATTLVIRRASGWIGPSDGYRMFVAVALVRMVQMAIVQIVDVTVVHDRGVPAAGSV